MKNNYQHIFSPLTVRNMTLKNRIVMMPMELLLPLIQMELGHM